MLPREGFKGMRLGWTPLFLSALAAVGCGGGGGGSGDGGGGGGGSSASSGAAAGESTGSTTTYDNGHPLISPTGDSAVLARELEVITLVNDHRVSLGKDALIDAGNVRDVSRGHSGHMIVHDFFAHVNPEGDSPGGRLSRAGIGWTMAGENIAAGFSTADSAFSAWMNSPGHKENIERDGWSHTGVGYAYDAASTYTWYWTQNFVKP